MQRKEIFFPIFLENNKPKKEAIINNTLSNSSETYKRNYELNYENDLEEAYYTSTNEIKKNNTNYGFDNKNQQKGSLVKKKVKTSKLKNSKINNKSENNIKKKNLDKLFNIILDNKDNTSFINNLNNFANERKCLKKEIKAISNEFIQKLGYLCKKRKNKKKEFISKKIKEPNIGKKDFFLIPGLLEGNKKLNNIEIERGSLNINKKKIKNKIRNTTGKEKEKEDSKNGYLDSFLAESEIYPSSNIDTNERLKNSEHLDNSNNLNNELFFNEFKSSIIKIELNSNWGSQNHIGINEIKLFNSHFQEIIIKNQNINLYNKFLNEKVDLICSDFIKNKKKKYDLIKLNFKVANIINNRINSIKVKDMLLLPYKSKNLFIITLTDIIEPKYLVFWNFNQDLTVGVKKCTVFFKGQKVFEGDISKGSGKLNNSSYFSIICLSSDSNDNKLNQILVQKYGIEKNDKRNSSSSISRKKTSKGIKEEMFNLIENNIFLTHIKNNQKNDKQPKETQLKNSMLIQEEFNNSLFNSQINSRDYNKEENKTFEGYSFGKNEKNSISKNSKKNIKIKMFSKDILEKAQIDLKKSFYKTSDFFITESVQSKFIDPNKVLEITKKKFNIKNSKKKITAVEKEQKHKFKIKNLPEVNGLTFTLNKTWGDPSFVGLFRIEIFNILGKLVKVNSFGVFDQDNNKIKTNLNILIRNLTFKTSKEDHWLCPLKNNYVSIKFKFKQNEEISMIRIWNYNTSRINLARGVKDITISCLKRKEILFQGQIKMASGNLQYFHNNYESILFTKDAKILTLISENDYLFQYLKGKQKITLNNNIKKRLNDFLQNRPLTLEKKSFQKRESQFQIELLEQKQGSQLKEFSKKPKLQIKEIKKDYIEVNNLKLKIISNWGDKKEFGFSGVEFFDEDSNKIPIIFYELRIHNTKQNSSNLINRLKKLMPTFFYLHCNNTSIEYIFKETMKIKKIHFFNICENYALNQTGIKLIDIYNNNQKINTEVIYIKQGNILDSVSKTVISFPIKYLNLSGIDHNSSYFTGFTLKFHLKTTFGDPYYIGLNEIEIFDAKGKNITQEKAKKITASPEGVYILDRMSEDIRRIENITNQVFVSDKYKDIWLAPLIKYKIQKRKNTIIIDFEEPFILGMINIWNYSKCVERGVKEIDILFDDQLIYSGELINNNQNNLNSLVFYNNCLNNLKLDVQVNQIKDISSTSDIVQLVEEGIVWQKALQKNEVFSGYRPMTGLDEY